MAVGAGGDATRGLGDWEGRESEGEEWGDRERKAELEEWRRESRRGPMSGRPRETRVSEGGQGEQERRARGEGELL